MSQEVHGLFTPPLPPIDPTGRAKDYGYSSVGINKDPRKSIDNGHGQGQGSPSRATYSPSVPKPITQSTVENQNQQDIATPSLTSNSTISELSINQLGLSHPSSSASIYTESEGVKSNDDTPIATNKIGTGTETTLDSLAKLRQFKAEVEATRQHSHPSTYVDNKGNPSGGVGMGEMNPSHLAKMAESFILQQRQKLDSADEGKIASTNTSIEPADDSGYSRVNALEGSGSAKERELELKERLLSSRLRPSENQDRKRNSESNSPFDERAYGYEQNKRPRNDVQLPVNPPWNDRYKDRGRSSSTIRSDNHDDSDKYPRFPPPHPSDPRFTRREQSTGTTSSGPDYKPSETNFVPSRYQNPPGRGHQRDRRYSQEGQGRPRTPPSPPIRNEPGRNNVNRSFGREREGYGYDNQGQRLADRISGGGASPAPKYRPRSPSPARTYSNTRREREYPRPPSPPRHYPGPRTPVDTTYGRRPDIPTIDPYDTYANARGQPLRHARPPSPGYGRPPPPSMRDQRYGYDSKGREDAYLGAPPPPPTPPGYHDRYDRPPPPPPPPIGGNVFAQGQGMDTNNVVETLEALKAQISKLEKLVPTAGTNVNTQPPPLPPPPPRPQGYDPYGGYDHPREPHPREREYDTRPFPPPSGDPYQVRGRLPSPPPPPPHKYEDDHGPGHEHEHEYDDRPGPRNDRRAGHGPGPGYGRGRGRGHGHGHGGGGRGRGGGKRGRGGRGGRGGR
ncbi:hypothetical protein I204_06501 [Kwoniella mangroviensis CBS 8886]|nr:hypothetical protein I204_06501 [Kwoniella mangroviensis CBS 8886]